MNMFQSSSRLRHLPISAPSSLRSTLVTHEIILPLIWKSQALLCKDPLCGYMTATHLPQEIIEIILLYVGLYSSTRSSSSSSSSTSGSGSGSSSSSSSYREMNMNSMRKLIENEKKKARARDRSNSWKFLRTIFLIGKEQRESLLMFLVGIIVVLAVTALSYFFIPMQSAAPCLTQNQ
jgi:hypothetical protein